MDLSRRELKNLEEGEVSHSETSDITESISDGDGEDNSEPPKPSNGQAHTKIVESVMHISSSWQGLQHPTPNKAKIRPKFQEEKENRML